MSLLFTGKKIEGNHNVERLCCVSKNPITNKVSSTKDFIKFWNLSLFFGNINWNGIVFLKENLESWILSCTAEKQPALTHFN